MISPVFTRTRDFIRRYAVLDDHSLNIVTVWAMHTHLFSPACTAPATTPYLYVTAPKGSGKTLLGQDVMGAIVRAPMATVGVTGAGLIRLVGGSDDERSAIAASPTLIIDEIDALYSGAKDEVLRMMLNAGYRRGATVPRVVGDTVVSYSAYCPKILMGIDNGHLPDTVEDRSIRVSLQRATAEEMATVEPFFLYEVEDEAAELAQELAAWAQEHSAAIRDQRPAPVPEIAKVPRHWEVARTLIQVAMIAGVETEVTTALISAFERDQTEAPEIQLLKAIRGLFEAEGTDRLSSAQILRHLAANGLSVPGGTGKGLAVKLSEYGIKAGVIRVPADHPDASPGSNCRGYYRHSFTDTWERFCPIKEGE